MESTQFVVIASQEERLISLINLGQICSASVVDDGVQLRLGNGDIVNVRGAGSNELFKFLFKRSIFVEGTSGESAEKGLEAALERLRKKD